MTRNTLWQHVASDKLTRQQDLAFSAKLYILHELGPTSFLLKEDKSSRKIKVSLGDPHVCNCSYFKKEETPCQHICWILLKRFKLSQRNELSFQLGLVEREIDELLHKYSMSKNSSTVTSNPEPQICQGKQVLQQRLINKDDVCPICQENLLMKHQPVTFCRYGCGNSVHIKCMKIWVDHQLQTSGNDKVMCPFCRGEFADAKLLLREYLNVQSEMRMERLDHHIGYSCSICKMEPIKGKCYKCTTCQEFYLCNFCFHSKIHDQHSFMFRLKCTQYWKNMQHVDESVKLQQRSSLLDLQTRELTENDYDLLLRLDRPSANVHGVSVDLAGLPEHVINSLPICKVKLGSRLLNPGSQCRLCLQCYSAGDLLRRLPDCGHVFHRVCIDGWLKNDHRRCPVDEIPVTKVMKKLSLSDASPLQAHAYNEPDKAHKDIFLPGIKLHSSGRTTVIKKGMKKQIMKRSPGVSPQTIPSNEPLHHHEFMLINRLRCDDPIRAKTVTAHFPLVATQRQTRIAPISRRKLESLQSGRDEQYDNDATKLCLLGTQCPFRGCP